MTNFRDYCRQAAAEQPRQGGFARDWERVVQSIQGMLNGDAFPQNLLIITPPQWGKTTLATLLGAYWLNSPVTVEHNRLLLASWSAAAAVALKRRVTNLLASDGPWAAGDISVIEHADTVSVGGSLTGQGYGLVVLDEPFRPNDDLSYTRVFTQWWENVLLSRTYDDTRLLILTDHADHPFVVERRSAQWVILDLTDKADTQQASTEIEPLPFFNTGGLDGLSDVQRGAAIDRAAKQLLADGAELDKVQTVLNEWLFGHRMGILEGLRWELTALTPKEGGGVHLGDTLATGASFHEVLRKALEAVEQHSKADAM